MSDPFETHYPDEDTLRAQMEELKRQTEEHLNGRVEAETALAAAQEKIAELENPQSTDREQDFNPCEVDADALPLAETRASVRRLRARVAELEAERDGLRDALVDSDRRVDSMAGDYEREHEEAKRLWAALDRIGNSGLCACAWAGRMAREAVAGKTDTDKASAGGTRE